MKLKEIIESRKKTIEKIKKILPLKDLIELTNNSKNYVNIESLFETHHPVFFCEIKFASPSLGSINKNNNYLETAEQYLSNGASALSVLTEPQYFKGDIQYIPSLREKHPEAFILQKDFIFSEYQVYLAKYLGANAFLLIADALSPYQLKSLVQLAGELKISCLVEAHDEENLEKAHNSGAKVFGINNRNLKTMKVNLKNSYSMKSFFKEDNFYISESGISKPKEISELYNMGYSGFLIGSSLMKHENPGLAFRELTKLCR